MPVPPALRAALLRLKGQQFQHRSRIAESRERLKQVNVQIKAIKKADNPKGK